MIWHFIIMSSSYSLGRRIALDVSFPVAIEQKTIDSCIRQIMEECGSDVSISTHLLSTKAESWESVVDSDLFFQDVERIDTIEEFCNLIRQDQKLSGMDVANYILSKVKCTHLKLEKLTYFCYADYLCNKKRQLFQDNIYAFRYGPVIDSVYREFKKHGHDTIELEEKEWPKAQDIQETIPEPMTGSRILFSKDGIEKMKSIDRTLEMYGQLSAGALVSLTHRQGSPWDLSGRGEGTYRNITDGNILKGHKVEIP